MSGLDVTVFPHDFAWGAATAAYQIEGEVYSSAHVYCSITVDEVLIHFIIWPDSFANAGWHYNSLQELFNHYKAYHSITLQCYIIITS